MHDQKDRGFLKTQTWRGFGSSTALVLPDRVLLFATQIVDAIYTPDTLRKSSGRTVPKATGIYNIKNFLAY